MTERARAFGAFGLVAVVVFAFPALTDRDSYPLSVFPMFSSHRTTQELVDTAVAVRADGSVQRLSPQVIAGTDEVILATATVGDAVGAGHADDLCREIASRVEAGRPGLGAAARVQVVAELFDAVQWYSGDREPLRRTVHAECEVP